MWPELGTGALFGPDAGRLMPVDLGFVVGAGEGNRTLMTSLEGWGSAIELRPRARWEVRPAPGWHRQRTGSMASRPSRGIEAEPPEDARATEGDPGRRLPPGPCRGGCFPGRRPCTGCRDAAG